MDKSVEDRFWCKVDIRSEGECWEWQAGINSTGRGIFQLSGKSVHAHRACWMIVHGEIPNNLQVLHKCDNGRCVNPSHLFLGTQKDNMHDMAAKGRKVVRRGEDDPKHKLTTSQVREIKRLYKPRTFSQFRLAAIFGVSRSAIESILRGDTWKHIDE